MEQFKYITTVLEHNHAVAKLFINTGETLLKIPHPMLKLHPIHLFSLLSYLSHITANWSEECMQSYKLPQLGQGLRLSRQRFLRILD